MYAFTSNIRQRFRAVYKPMHRNSRPAKRRALQQDIAAALQQNEIPSPISDVTSNSEELPAQHSPMSSHSSEGRFEDAEERIESTPSIEARPLIPGNSSSVHETSEPDSESIDRLEESADSEDERILEPGDEQEMRDQAYIRSCGEEPDDYTDGPVRMVIASDGIKHCGALLMTFELSQKLQKAFRAQRDYAKAETKAVDTDEINLRFRAKLKAQIARNEYRMTNLLDEDQGEVGAECADLQAQLATLNHMLEEAKGDYQRSASNLQTRADILREIQARAIAASEEAFVYAMLIEPETDEPDTPIEDKDLDLEFRRAHEGLSHDCDDDMVPASPVGLVKEFVEPKQLTEQEQAVNDVKETFWSIHRRLQEARYAFDHREAERARELYANQVAAERGEPTTDASPDDFDARWLRKIQELTRDLVDASVAFGEAKAAVREAGIDIALDDQTSGFADDADDGYRMSFEQEQITSVPSPRVRNWLSAVPENAAADLEDATEVDQWDAKEVDISDSVSLVAEGSNRTKIDKWRKVCGL